MLSNGGTLRAGALVAVVHGMGMRGSAAPNGVCCSTQLPSTECIAAAARRVTESSLRPSRCAALGNAPAPPRLPPRPRPRARSTPQTRVRLRSFRYGRLLSHSPAQHHRGTAPSSGATHSSVRRLEARRAQTLRLRTLRGSGLRGDLRRQTAASTGVTTLLRNELLLLGRDAALVLDGQRERQADEQRRGDADPDQLPSDPAAKVRVGRYRLPRLGQFSTRRRRDNVLQRCDAVQERLVAQRKTTLGHLVFVVRQVLLRSASCARTYIVGLVRGRLPVLLVIGRDVEALLPELVGLVLHFFDAHHDRLIATPLRPHPTEDFRSRVSHAPGASVIRRPCIGPLSAWMSAEPTKVPPDAPTADEEARRAALRLAALQSRKSGASAKKTAPAKDAPGPVTAAHTEVSPTPTPTSPAAANREPPTPRPPAPRRATHRNGYRDVDMPDTGAVDLLAYLDYDQPSTSTAPDARRTRPRISYADEFSTNPIAPSGEVGLAPWLDLPLDAAVSSPPVHTTPRSFPRRQTVVSSGPKQDPHTVARSITQNTFSNFVNRPLHGPFIIEWSDDEDEEDDTRRNEERVSAFAMRDALGDNARSILVSSAVLSEKEREIQRMIARIQELEQRKRTQPGTSTRGTVGDTVDEPTTAVLGKRTGSVCEEAIQSAGSTTKVRMRFHIARRSRTTYAAATKNEECCSTQHKSEHVQCTWNTFLHCVIRLTNSITDYRMDSRSVSLGIRQ